MNKSRNKSKSPQEIEKILNCTRISMEVEGFVIDKELEEVGRRILMGELRRKDYVEQVKLEASRYAHEV